MTQITIPQDILDAARMTPEQLTIELAITLYAQGRLSIGKARELAGMSLWEFRQLLASRKINPHYAANDLDDDIATLQDKGLM